LQNGEVDTDEFLRGVETACKGKSYQDLPAAFKFFIEAQFRTIDVDGKNKGHSCGGYKLIGETTFKGYYLEDSNKQSQCYEIEIKSL